MVQQHEEALLRHYHSTLTGALAAADAAAYTWEVALEHFEWSLLDFVRFQAGWGFWGNERWATSKAKAHLKVLIGTSQGG